MNDIKKITLRERFSRAIKAFKGQKVGSLEFGFSVKRCSECSRTEETDPVLYVCDRNNPDCADICDSTTCLHTTNVHYAKNFRNVMSPHERPVYVELTEEEK